MPVQATRGSAGTTATEEEEDEEVEVEGGEKVECVVEGVRLWGLD